MTKAEAQLVNALIEAFETGRDEDRGNHPYNLYASAANAIEEICKERDEARAKAIEECARVAEDHYNRLDKEGFVEHGSQCLSDGCSKPIAKYIRALLNGGAK